MIAGKMLSQYGAASKSVVSKKVKSMQRAWSFENRYC